MNPSEVMKALESLGGEQTRETWRRHGAAEPMFGVKFGDLGKLQKPIKTDHDLAKTLWKSGNHDARLLACLVADPSKATEQELKTWAGQVKDSATAEALATFASPTPRTVAITNVDSRRKPFRSIIDSFLSASA